MTDVLIGRDDVLFHATSLHSILDHLTGKKEIPPEAIENFGTNIRQRAAFCRQLGIKYRHVIYPDKSTVLKSYFPVPNTRSFSDRYRHLFDENVLDLADYLPDSGDSFLRTDTHLAFNGMVTTTIDVASSFMAVDRESAERALQKMRGPAYDMLGDLGSKMSPQITETHYHISAPSARLFNNLIGPNDGLTVVCFNLDKLRKREIRRLLIFGDSFMERTLRLMSHFYSEILFCRTRYLHDEVVLMFKPDDLITESAERYFSSVRLDENANRFDLLYGLREGKYSEDKAFYVAYNAVLNFRKPTYDIFVKRLLMAG